MDLDVEPRSPVRLVEVQLPERCAELMVVGAEIARSSAWCSTGTWANHSSIGANVAEVRGCGTVEEVETSLAGAWAWHRCGRCHRRLLAFMVTRAYEYRLDDRDRRFPEIGLHLLDQCCHPLKLLVQLGLIKKDPALLDPAAIQRPRANDCCASKRVHDRRIIDCRDSPRCRGSRTR